MHVRALNRYPGWCTAHAWQPVAALIDYLASVCRVLGGVVACRLFPGSGVGRDVWCMSMHVSTAEHGWHTAVVES